MAYKRVKQNDYDYDDNDDDDDDNDDYYYYDDDDDDDYDHDDDDYLPGIKGEKFLATPLADMLPGREKPILCRIISKHSQPFSNRTKY